MNSLKPILKNSSFLIFLLFLFLHVALFNINSVEWGDSYRILRASEYIRDFSYPSDEKRPPLFSVLLAMRPEGVDQVLWGKGVMMGISVLCFWIFYKLCKLIFKNERQVNLALLLFSLNPVYFYWSLRIYADVPLSFFVLLAFYFLVKWKNILNPIQLFVLGLITALSVMTRFEGYLLFGAITIGIFFATGKNLKKIFLYFGSFGLMLLPYLYFRNPLTSSYFEEPSNREFNLETIAAYILSLLFVYGCVYAWFFIFNSKRKLIDFAKAYPGILVFVFLNLVLVFLWPAAVPRLFVSAIPFLILLLSMSIENYFSENKKISLLDYTILFGLVVVFVLGQLKFRLQFLVPNSNILYLLISLQLPILYLIIKKNYKVFLVLLIASMLVWSVSTVYLHKNIYTSLKLAAEYTQKNLNGTVLYNDTSSVSDWYLNEKAQEDQVEGFYANFDNKEYLTAEYLKSKSINYLLISNEHNPDLNIDISKRPYLELVTEFKYKHGGKVFFTKIVKVNV